MLNLLRSVKITITHLSGVFIVMLAALWLVDFFFRLDGAALVLLPALFFLYVGVALLFSRRK